MNILLINHYAGSPRHGMEFRPYYLAREWVRLGHSVSIVAASESHVRTRRPAVSDGVTEEWLDGIRYIWLKTPPYAGNGVGRVRNMASFVGRLWGMVNKLTRELKPDVVIASSTYPLDIYPAGRIARLSGAKLIFEVHDLWPLSPMELGGMSRWHPFIMVMQMAENHAYRVSDRIISMLPNAREHMGSHGMAPHKFAHVPNGIVVSEWLGENEPLPEEHAGALAALREKGLFIVGYAGAHGIANALGSFVEAGVALGGEAVCFVLVGNGPEKDALMGLAKNGAPDSVVFLPPVPKGAIPELLARMDACYIGLQRQPLFRFGVSPNKLMDYMMAATPIIYAIEAGNDPVQDSGCGISVPPENADAIIDAVRRLMTLSPAEREVMGNGGKEYVQKHHDYRILAQHFLESVQQMHAEKRI